jgi:hypothetical protein
MTLRGSTIGHQFPPRKYLSVQKGRASIGMPGPADCPFRRPRRMDRSTRVASALKVCRAPRENIKLKYFELCSGWELERSTWNNLHDASLLKSNKQWDRQRLRGFRMEAVHIVRHEIRSGTGGGKRISRGCSTFADPPIRARESRRRAARACPGARGERSRRAASSRAPARAAARKRNIPVRSRYRGSAGSRRLPRFPPLP